ncbi:MAG: chromosomal replication initiator protein DnaA [Bacteroidaceae bacterium]|nr:chromosomal replication initiator protein DnaA [Bacteroidaceae bacterium]
MNIDYKSKWENCRHFISDNISPEQYKTIFAFVEFESFNDGKLYLNVPSSFVKDVIEEKYLRLMRTALRRFFGEVSLYYRILKDKEGGTTATEEGTHKTDITTPRQQTTRPANVSPTQLSASNPSELDSQLNTIYNFDTFIEGESNRLARSVGEAIAKNPAKTFNPLFVFGPSGCGKSHLVNAIGWRIKELHPQLRVLYVSAHLFTVQWGNAVRKNLRNDFIAFYQTIDVLIIDDVQEFSGKQDTQNTFFHIFNHLHLNKKQIILTADRPPIDILGLEDRLLTRFKWGLQAEIEKPTKALRLSILNAKINQEGLNIPQTILNYIAENVDDSVRDLEGMINSLMAHSIVYNCDIDMKLVNKVMPKFKAKENTNKEFTVETIRDKVCEHFNITAETLTSRTRKQPISYIRQITIYLANKFTDESIVQIGLKLGGRNHATVIHAIKNIRNLESVDQKTKDDIECLENLLRS